MQHSVEYSVVENDIDELGHMNFLRYVSLYNECRLQWLTTINLDKSKRCGQNLGLVVLNFEITYLHEIRLGEKIKVTTELKRKGNKSFTVFQKIHSNEQLCSETTVILTLMDLAKRKAIELPPEVRNIELD
ncbi:MAG: acyl-CoA thioesterase [Kurthia sp.]|nr:acyl-CoA thioesterase [Candidatus Kurthia equi]